jgi:redox-sensitive bicupin YhaK (pirin superfamily)
MSERLVIKPHTKDLGGGFLVRRLLPSLARQAVGPFLFLDHFGPLVSKPSDDHDVRPHPHIGLATVTYLFDGAMLHRDSTGVMQRIEPGAINWMTAGRGVVHSERTPDDLRDVERTSHGLQLWAALPPEDEELEPSFWHSPAAALPLFERGGATLRVLIGHAFAAVSPVPTRSPTVYVDVSLVAGASLVLDVDAAERAVYGVAGDFTLGGRPFERHAVVMLDAGERPRLTAVSDARLVLLGGAPLGHRFMWWNFVSSRKERIVQAADDWAARRFAPVPGDEIEFVPLPERRP